MIEKYLIDLGLGCGTVKNFNNVVVENMRNKIAPRWYFKTPVKISGSGLKSAVVNLAYPFHAMPTEVDESTAMVRLEAVRKNYEDDLLFILRKHKLIVPPDSANFIVIPFWATETGERNERKDFAQLRIHIISATITIKYRESWFN